jgi:hypothetical protein
MTTTTYVATTAEGNTVARTSATRDYNFVILVKNSITITSQTDAHDAIEGVWSWSGDFANAEKAAQSARKAYVDVRIVDVEQKLTGKDARLVLDAIKAAKIGDYADNTTAAAMIAAADADPAMTEVKPARKDKAKKKTTTADVEMVAKAIEKVQAEAKPAAGSARKYVPGMRADLSKLEDIIASLRDAEAKLAAAHQARNAEIARLLGANEISGPKLAAYLGMTPMAIYNMRNRATA